MKLRGVKLQDVSWFWIFLCRENLYWALCIDFYRWAILEFDEKSMIRKSFFCKDGVRWPISFTVEAMLWNFLLQLALQEKWEIKLSTITSSSSELSIIASSYRFGIVLHVLAGSSKNSSAWHVIFCHMVICDLLYRSYYTFYSRIAFNQCRCFWQCQRTYSDNVKKHTVRTYSIC